MTRTPLRCRRCSRRAIRADRTSSASARRRPAPAGCSTSSPSIPTSGCRRSRSSTISTRASASSASPGRSTNRRARSLRSANRRRARGHERPLVPDDIAWLEARMWLHQRPLDLDRYARLFNPRGDRLSGDICPPYAILPGDEARGGARPLPRGADRLPGPRSDRPTVVAVLHDPPPSPAGGAGVGRDGEGLRRARHRPRAFRDTGCGRALAAWAGRSEIRAVLLRRSQDRRGGTPPAAS